MENNNINLDKNLINEMTIHTNLRQEIIITNTDKVKLILNDHHEIIKRKIEWLNPVGIFLTVLTTILTAKFDETKFGISPQMLKAIFVISCILSFVFSIILIFNAVRYRKKGTIEEFIEKLKIDSTNSQLTTDKSNTNNILKN